MAFIVFDVLTYIRLLKKASKDNWGAVSGYVSGHETSSRNDFVSLRSPICRKTQAEVLCDAIYCSIVGFLIQIDQKVFDWFSRTEQLRQSNPTKRQFGLLRKRQASEGMIIRIPIIRTYRADVPQHYTELTTNKGYAINRFLKICNCWQIAVVRG